MSIKKSNPDALCHVRVEIAMLEKLRGHPNILFLHDHFEDEEYVHVVLDLCEGGDLCEFVRGKGRLSELESAQAMATILRAVLLCLGETVAMESSSLQILVLLQTCRRGDLSLRWKGPHGTLLPRFLQVAMTRKQTYGA